MPGEKEVMRSEARAGSAKGDMDVRTLNGQTSSGEHEFNEASNVDTSLPKSEEYS